MDIRELTPDFFVSPQIAPDHVPMLSARGITCVINNRPDMEVPEAVRSAAMRGAVEAAGLTYLEVPADGRSMGLDTVAQQKQAIGRSIGPTLAYCASGTRSTILWAFASAGLIETDEIIAAALRAGYDISAYRPQIGALASQNV